jgi:hypothetical protein
MEKTPEINNENGKVVLKKILLKHGNAVVTTEEHSFNTLLEKYKAYVAGEINDEIVSILDCEYNHTSIFTLSKISMFYDGNFNR